MRTLTLILIVGFGLFLGPFTPDSQAQVNVTVSWNPSPSPTVLGYDLFWGTNSGKYIGSNVYYGNVTTGTISNLAYDITYYINVLAFASNGILSGYAGEVTFMSNEPPPTSPTLPGLPGGPSASGHTASKGPPSVPGSGTTGSGVTGNTASSGSGSGSGSSAAASSTNITQAQIWGIPPMLSMALSNHAPLLNIAGTVGATVMVQCTSNLAAAYSWSTVADVALTNPAPIESNNVPGQPQDAIDLAYVPALQPTPVPTNSDPGAQFFRIVMPYDYIVLAGSVLPQKGYASRLILVNMPGLNDDACYVGSSSSFIHYNQTNAVLQLEGSGATIRQIANTLANNLNLDWTTASEFVYSNGMAQILATVVESEPASSDPVAGKTPTSSISINF